MKCIFEQQETPPEENILFHDFHQSQETCKLTVYLKKALREDANATSDM